VTDIANDIALQSDGKIVAVGSTLDVANQNIALARYNTDGSLDLYLQHDSPGKDKEANWLPAPAGRFKPMLRMYWPKQPVLSGEWVPPPIVKQPASAAKRATTPPL